MTEECKMPEPGAQHAKILEGVGTWDVDCKHFMDPSQPPLQSKAVDVVEPLGGFWTVSKFTGDVMGMPFHGIAQTGYSQIAKKYVMTWIDSMSSHVFMMEGDFDASGKKLTVSGPGPDMTGQALTNWTITCDYHSKDKMTMKMFIESPMGAFQLLENVYTRRK